MNNLNAYLAFRSVNPPWMFLHFHGIHEDQPVHKQRVAQGFGESEQRFVRISWYENINADGADTTV